MNAPKTLQPSVSEAAALRALFASNAPWSEIHRRMGYSMPVLQRWRKQLRIPMQPRGRKPRLPQHAAAITAFRADGWSMQQIAQSFSVDARTVWRFINEQRGA